MDQLYVICRTVEIDDRDVKGFVLMRAAEDGEAVAWPIMITRKGSQFFGYENVCPHEGLRLDTAPGQFLDEEDVYKRQIFLFTNMTLSLSSTARHFDTTPSSPKIYFELNARSAGMPLRCARRST